MKFRLVDKILQWQPRDRISGIKTVSFEEYELKAAFGGQPHLPESLLIESLFQLGNWLIVLSTDFQQMGLVIRTGQFHFLATVRPGQIMALEVTARSWRDDGVLFDGKASVDGHTVAHGTGCLATPVELAEYQDPADMQVLFSEIHRPEQAGNPQSPHSPIARQSPQ